MDASTRVPRRVDALTGLRWFAAMGVVLTHFAVPDDAPQWLRTLGANGYLGVPFFFTLSGFALAVRYGGRDESLCDYAARRFWRIAPAYWLALLAGWAVLQRSPAVDRFLVVHALALQAWLPNAGDVFAYNAPGWTISVELFLYACFPLLIRPLRHRCISARMAVGYIVAGLGASAAYALASRAMFGPAPELGADSSALWILRLPAAHLPTFVVGLGIGLLFVGRVEATSVTRVWPLVQGVVFATAVIVLTSLRQRDSYSMVLFVDTIGATAGSGILIASCALAERSRLSAILGSQPMIFLGTASYAMYLLHMPILHALRDISLPYYLGYPTRVIALIALATSLHRCIEQPLYRRLTATAPAR